VHEGCWYETVVKLAYAGPYVDVRVAGGWAEWYSNPLGPAYGLPISFLFPSKRCFCTVRPLHQAGSDAHRLIASQPAARNAPVPNPAAKQRSRAAGKKPTVPTAKRSVACLGR
jgi:hypothetical protein